jgi:hypothetical protein
MRQKPFATETRRGSCLLVEDAYSCRVRCDVVVVVVRVVVARCSNYGIGRRRRRRGGGTANKGTDAWKWVDCSGLLRGSPVS